MKTLFKRFLFKINELSNSFHIITFYEKRKKNVLSEFIHYISCLYEFAQNIAFPNHFWFQNLVGNPLFVLILYLSIGIQHFNMEITEILFSSPCVFKTQC